MCNRSIRGSQGGIVIVVFDARERRRWNNLRNKNEGLLYI